MLTILYKILKNKYFYLSTVSWVLMLITFLLMEQLVIGFIISMLTAISLMLYSYMRFTYEITSPQNLIEDISFKKFSISFLIAAFIYAMLDFSISELGKYDLIGKYETFVIKWIGSTIYTLILMTFFATRKFNDLTDHVKIALTDTRMNKYLFAVLFLSFCRDLFSLEFLNSKPMIYKLTLLPINSISFLMFLLVVERLQEKIYKTSIEETITVNE